MIASGRAEEAVSGKFCSGESCAACQKKQLPGTVLLTGGLSECPYFAEIPWKT